MQKLTEKEIILKTGIVTSSDSKKTFSLTKTIDGLQGGKGIFILLYPTRTIENLHVEDSTNVHLLNHLKELGFSRYTIVNLFSTVTQSRLSTRSLLLDEENLDYIKNTVFSNYNRSTDKVVIAWGNSHQSSKIVNQAKLKVLKMWAEMHQNTEIYQLSTAGLNKENVGVHPLYLGIRHPNSLWKLAPYPLIKMLKELVPDEKKELLPKNPLSTALSSQNAAKPKHSRKQ